jgi:antitoxin FitA
MQSLGMFGWRIQSDRYRTCAINDCNDIIDCMASITIRNLEETTKRKLKVRAAINGRSMEQEAREILKSALKSAPKKRVNLAEAIHRRFARLGGVDLEPLPREFVRDPDWLKDWKE